MSSNAYLSLTELAGLSSLLDANQMMVILGEGGDEGQGTASSVGSIPLSSFRDDYLLVAVNEEIADLQSRPGNGSFASPVTITLTGVVTGSASFDGTENFSLVTAMPNNSIPIAAVEDLASTLASITAAAEAPFLLGSSYYSNLNAATQSSVLGYWNSSTSNISGQDQFGTIVTFASDGEPQPDSSNFVNQLGFGNNGTLTWRRNIQEGGWSLVSLWHSGNFTPSNYLPIAGAYDAIAPTSTLGDITYRGATVSARLAGNTTAVPKVLIQTGTGTVSAAPTWGLVGLSSMANLPATTLIGNGLATAGVPAAITIGSGLSLSALGVLSAAGGSGTVTAVTVATANGVSATVANQGSTPTLTISLGAITPTSITQTGSSVASAASIAGGLLINQNSFTVTDNTTAASGTASAAEFNRFGIPTLAAVNTAVTYPAAYTVFIGGAPAAGTNVTLTSTYSLFVNQGNSFFGGNIGIGTNPISAPNIGNPVVGANNLVMYNAGNIAHSLLTDSATTRTQQYSFGAAGLGLFDAGMSYDTTSRQLVLHAVGTSVLTLSNTTATFNGIVNFSTSLAQVDATGQFISQGTSPYKFRLVQGSYGAVWYSDGSNVYLLMTASGNQLGTFNGLRPFNANLVTGTVGMANGVNISGGLNVDTITASGNINGQNLNAGSGRLIMGYDSGVAGSINLAEWVRSSGNVGWFAASYGIGIYCIDSTFVRAYNGSKMAAADFVVTSDRNQKKLIRPLEYRGRLTPRSFTMRETGKGSFGFIAQEVRKLYPEAVSDWHVKNEKYLSLSYNLLTAVLSHQVNAVEDELTSVKQLVQNQQRQIDELRELVMGIMPSTRKH